jgi:hypothetical protein
MVTTAMQERLRVATIPRKKIRIIVPTMTALAIRDANQNGTIRLTFTA